VVPWDRTLQDIENSHRLYTAYILRLPWIVYWRRTGFQGFFLRARTADGMDSFSFSVVEIEWGFAYD
jgi:hypothetical protein